MFKPENIRNIAIIAHVDHGKTTLLDALLKQSQTFRENSSEMSEHLIMDSGDQESERGITITAKNTAIIYEDKKINIIDTPGHADFSGEVERTLGMADGVILVVDAQEGPMPQTKFVLGKALGLGLRPIIVINKIDKPARRIAEVEGEIGDLFLELASDDSQLEYPIYYAVARDGRAWESMPENVDMHGDMKTIFEAIIREIPAPNVDLDGPFQMQVTSLDYDSFLGKYAIGRINRGVAKSGSQIANLRENFEETGEKINAKIDKIFTYQGLSRNEVKEATAGDIVAIVGATNANIGETLTDPNATDVLPTIEVEPPTISVYLGPNTSPFKGKESKFNTSRQIGDRLERELETNVALKVEQSGIGFTVSGRGELHLSVLMETLRREGFEFEVGRPQVVLREKDGVKEEPVEEVFVEVAPEFVGAIAQEFGARHAELLNQEITASNTSRSHYKIPTRGLIGLRNLLLTATKGTVIMNSLPAGYQPLGEKLNSLRNGALIASETGVSTAYAISNAESRGEFFIGAGAQVYAGQVVGLNNRKEDLEINVAKAKNLTNMRSKSSDGTVQLTPFTDLSLEQCIDFLNDDELLEITPESLRLRKRELDPTMRKRAGNGRI